MLAMTIMTAICLAGVAFYLRFLVAICKERKYRWIGYLVRLQPDQNEYAIPQPREIQGPLDRAA